MKPEEAIKILECLSFNQMPDVVVAIRAATQALGKEIVKPLVPNTGEKSDVWEEKCQTCGCLFSSDADYERCVMCGQKLREG